MTTPRSCTCDDHFALERLCTRLDIDQGSPEHRKNMADRLIRQFADHPVTSDVEQVMRELREAGPAEPRFERLLSAVLHAVRQHVHPLY